MNNIQRVENQLNWLYICQTVYVAQRHTHVPTLTVEYDVTASNGEKRRLPQTTAGWRSPTRLNTFLTLFFFSSSPYASFSPPYRNYTHITVQGVIYLEPIANSSLRLNENVEKCYKATPTQDILVKGWYQHITAGCWDGSSGDSKQGWRQRGSQEATTRVAHVKPFGGHAVKCRSLTVLYCMCFWNGSGGAIKIQLPAYSSCCSFSLLWHHLNLLFFLNHCL